MSTSLVERCYRTALHPLDWNIQRISLDTYTANLGKSIGSSRVTTRHLPFISKILISYTTIYERNAIPVKPFFHLFLRVKKESNLLPITRSDLVDWSRTNLAKHSYYNIRLFSHTKQHINCNNM